MDAVSSHFASIGLSLLPVALCFIGIALVVKRQGIVAAAHQGRRETATNLTLFIVNYLLFIPIVAAPALGVVALVPNWDHFAEQWQNIPTPVDVVLALALTEFAAYWRHRFEHTSFMWRYHATHHSDETLNWFSVKRKHPVGKLFEVMIDVAPAILIGAPVPAIAAAQIARGWWGYLIHADVPWTLGPLGRVLMSPAAHRLHHIRDEALMGSNYGNMLTLWDRLFGTWADPNPYIGCETGIEGGSRDVWGELIRPWTMRLSSGPVAVTPVVVRLEHPPRERVDGALQDHRGGVAVDHLPALPAADVLRDKVALGA